MSNNDLLQKKCVPCEGGAQPLSKEEANKYMADVLGWEMDAEGKKITKEFKFKDFREAMVFVNKVADVANAEDHHPDIYIYYSKVKMDLSTHAIGGLSENDFIVAAKINHIN